MIQHQLERYARLLTDEQSVLKDRIAICGQNDALCCYGAPDLSRLAVEILAQLGSTAVIVAEPLYPFPFFLVDRSSPNSRALVPEDSESKSSLHDIPIVRKMPDREKLLNTICTVLRRRKGCIVEGIGMVSHGGLTVEQAYITWSSLMHATTIKYLQDLLSDGPVVAAETETLRVFRNKLKPVVTDNLLPCSDSPTSTQDILREVCRAGQITVQMGLVDSFFGNISWTNGSVMYISQTSARLDELATQIDPVPFDRSTTTGLTASSELPAHRAVVNATNCRAIVHGHPKFPIVMSFFCDPGAACEGVAAIDAFPVVRGEGGVGGLAESLSRAFHLTGANAVIVQGHGVFAISKNSFNEALVALAGVEQQCREHYFQRLYEKFMLE